MPRLLRQASSPTIRFDSGSTHSIFQWLGRITERSVHDATNFIQPTMPFRRVIPTISQLESKLPCPTNTQLEPELNPPSHRSSEDLMPGPPGDLASELRVPLGLAVPPTPRTKGTNLSTCIEVVARSGIRRQGYGDCISVPPAPRGAPPPL